MMSVLIIPAVVIILAIFFIIVNRIAMAIKRFIDRRKRVIKGYEDPMINNAELIKALKNAKHK
jgi:uncharacterized membrane protein YhaH (DUF805 family)